MGSVGLNSRSGQGLFKKNVFRGLCLRLTDPWDFADGGGVNSTSKTDLAGVSGATGSNDVPITTRRDFLKTSAVITTAGALAGVTVPHVFAAEDNTVRIALVGAGGRGSGAAKNALSVENAPTRLVAMADVFENKLKASYEGLKNNDEVGSRVDVKDEHKFLGFDAGANAMSVLRPGDIVILTTPPAFRWPLFKLAIEKGLHVFMEKPVCVDGPSARKMLALAEQASAKNLKVGVGLMIRHCKVRQDLFNKIQDGAIGDIVLMRGYRMHGPVASAFSKAPPEGSDELLYQINRFHSFIWASGGCFSDYYIHNIDECCWMKNAWPVSAQASGGRNYRGDFVDQNFDSYSVEYTFADGAKLMFYGRTMAGCKDQFASYAHGTKGLAVISDNGHWPSKARIYKAQKMANSEIVWRAPKEEGPDMDPYQVEWHDLVDAIRRDRPYNEVPRGVAASLTAVMGRMAAHTGQEITYEQALNHEHELAPGVDSFKAGSPPPLKRGTDGKYPIPQPGIVKNREYAG